jgi:hypothetical protein
MKDFPVILYEYKQYFHFQVFGGGFFENPGLREIGISLTSIKQEILKCLR